MSGPLVAGSHGKQPLAQFLRRHSLAVLQNGIVDKIEGIVISAGAQGFDRQPQKPDLRRVMLTRVELAQYAAIPAHLDLRRVIDDFNRKPERPEDAAGERSR